nr:zinc-binding dehydrogenase [Paraburkholderia kirstenboschensis]
MHVRLSRSDVVRRRGAAEFNPRAAEAIGAEGPGTLVVANNRTQRRALPSHRQTGPASFEMPVFAPALVYSAAEVRGWFIFSWRARNAASESSRTLSSLLDRMAEGTLKPPVACRYGVDRAHEAFAAAESAAHDARPLPAFAQR